MPALTPKQQELRESLRTDTPLWAKHCATILNDRREPVKLIPRPWQARTWETLDHIVPLDEALEKQHAAGMPMRALVLKARKLGFSTWMQARILQKLTQYPYRQALVVAQRQKTATVLFDMARLMYQKLPTEEQLGLGFSIRPQMIGQGATRNGSQWMSFGDKAKPEEASIYETSPASAAGGRGYTPNDLHLSEVAHYEDPMAVIGLLNSVPDLHGTCIVQESTANGFNHFYDRWVKAKEGAEDPETGGLYVPLFYGWQDNPYNAMDFPTPEARERFINTIGDEDGGGDSEEPWLVEQFECSPEQLRWRRVTISDKCNDSIDVFHQEHPATDTQAFIGSGNPVFSGILVSRAIKAVEAAHAPVEGVLRGEDIKERRTRNGTVKVPQTALWVPESAKLDDEVWGRTSKLRVWEHPRNAKTRAPEDEGKPDGQYVVFADIAQGVGTLDEGDYSAIQVIDHESLMQVAAYHSRIAVHELPMILLLVATYYNHAWLAVEINNMGIGVNDALKKDYRYPRLYRRGRDGDDDREDRTEHKTGWLTSLKTKPLMEQTMGQALKEGTHGLRDMPTARQLTTYVEDDRGRHGAEKGSYDDLLMAWMGALRVASMELKPRAQSGKRKPRVPRDPLTGY